MAACDPRTFEHINRETFECLKAKLASAGYALEGDSGTIKGPMGIVIEYRWDGAAESLYTHVRERNFLVGCSRINAELENAIAGCGG